MYRYILLILIFANIVMTNAQNGNINQNQLNKIKKTYDKTDQLTKAMTNALSNNDILKLALNRENLNNIEHEFKYKVDVSGISNQKKSGRCWMYTSMNVLRPMVIDKYKLANFEFSQNYLYFWDILEKSNLYLQSQITHWNKPLTDRYVEWLFKNPVGDGGVWNSFTNLADKYGLIPKEVMPETNTSNNTLWMINIINRKLREDGLLIRNMASSKITQENIQSEKIKMLGEIYRILALNLGEPPTDFKYRFVNKDGELGTTKNYTPKKFMNEVLGDIIFSDYIMLMNDPTRDYYLMYEIQNDRNVLEGKNWTYLNLPSNEIKKICVESIKNNKAMYASCDVGKQLNNSIGYSDINNYDFESVYSMSFKMNKKQRIQTFESGSSHGMALIAVDVDENENSVKWQFENSWGVESGHNGYLTFTDNWFDEYMFRIVVHRDFIKQEYLKLLSLKPIILPPWDPMFSADE